MGGRAPPPSLTRNPGKPAHWGAGRALTGEKTRNLWWNRYVVGLVIRSVQQFSCAPCFVDCWPA